MRSNNTNLHSHIGLAVLLSALWFAPAQAAQDGYDASSTIAEANLLHAGEIPHQLKPGEFLWLPAAKVESNAPVMVVVSLRDQRAYVYRGGERIAVSTVSTGKPGNDTPTGVFPILQKKKEHYSNLYDSAPMPFMQRLTWDGIALHAGRIPGRPASHGCVRLPKEFARELFAITKHGQTVVVSEDGSVESLARAGLSEQLALLVGTASSIQEIVNLVDPTASVDSSGGDSTMDSAYNHSIRTSFANQQ